MSEEPAQYATSANQTHSTGLVGLRNRAFIGIDPGGSGGVSYFATSTLLPYPSVSAYKMPETDTDIYELFKMLADRKENPFALIEQVHAMPRQGVCSVFTFGQNYGKLQMALVALGIPFERVTPQKWQKAMGCMTKGQKNISKARAQELFPLSKHPYVKITHATADALLIGEYARRTYGLS